MLSGQATQCSLTFRPPIKNIWSIGEPGEQELNDSKKD